MDKVPFQFPGSGDYNGSARIKLHNGSYFTPKYRVITNDVSDYITLLVRK
jgi:hypothetical protein